MHCAFLVPGEVPVLRTRLSPQVTAREQGPGEKNQGIYGAESSELPEEPLEELPESSPRVRISSRTLSSSRG